MKQDMKGKGLITATVCIMIYLAALVGGTFLIFGLYDRMFGADTAYAVENTLWLVCVAVPALCFFAVMAWLMKNLLGNTASDGSVQSQFIGVTAVFLTLLLAANFTAGMCVEQVDEEGVSKYLVRRGMHYSWADVDHYTLEEKGGEVLITLVMDNGKEFCYGNGLFGMSSDAFKEKFPDDTYDLWPYAAVEMKRQGVTAEADWELLEASFTDEKNLELIHKLKEINETAYYL